MKHLAATLLLTNIAATPVSIVFNTEPHCQSAKRQWETQHRTDERSHAYYRRFMGDFKRINETCDVMILQSHEARPQAEYPAIRFGRGKWRAIRKPACCPGMFIPAVRDICGDWNYELSEEYRQWQQSPYWHDEPKRPDASMWIEPMPLSEHEKPVDAPGPPFQVE